MNTRSIAMIAILAVAAVAIVGAGYAAYWGQTQVDDNDVTSEYIAVALSEGSGADYEKLNYDIEYDTIYSYNNGAKYEIKPNGFGTGFDNTTYTNHNLLPLKNVQDSTTKQRSIDYYDITIKSPKTINPASTPEVTYTLEVSLTGINLGTSAHVWFVMSNDTTLDDNTKDTWKELTAANGYTETFLATEVKATYDSETSGDATVYTGLAYGFLVLDITGDKDTYVEGQTTYKTVIIDDVNKAKASITDGVLKLKANVA